MSKDTDDNKEIKKRQSLSHLVVKDNVMIQKARFNLTTTQQKLIAYIISTIKPGQVDFEEVNIRVEDFCNLCGIDRNWFYSEFKSLVDNFDNSTFWVENENEMYKFRWFDVTHYYKNKGRVTIKLSSSLKAYLLMLTQQFTQYELYNIMALKSKYSIRLFELFKSYAYQRKKEMDIEELKRLLCAEAYTNFFDFKRRVLEPGITEINNFTELNVTYELIKKGKKVVKVCFIIGEKNEMGAYKSYIKTIDKINEHNKQIQGQLNLEDIFGNTI